MKIGTGSSSDSLSSSLSSSVSFPSILSFSLYFWSALCAECWCFCSWSWFGSWFLILGSSYLACGRSRCWTFVRGGRCCRYTAVSSRYQWSDLPSCYYWVSPISSAYSETSYWRSPWRSWLCSSLEAVLSGYLRNHSLNGFLLSKPIDNYLDPPDCRYWSHDHSPRHRGWTHSVLNTRMKNRWLRFCGVV